MSAWEIDGRSLAAMMKAGEDVFLVDVRQPWEHALAALPGSTLVPLDELANRADALAPPTDALVVVYCHHGVRSLHGAAILRRAGFDAAVSLAGGIDGWSLAIDASVPRY